MSELNGNVAVITGGSKGVGLGIARALVKEGVRVVITGRGEAALEAARLELLTLDPDAGVIAIRADNKDHDAARDIVTRTVAEFGRIDLLVNNAQEFRTGKALEDISWDDMISSYETGVFATWRLMVAALPHLKATKGAVINMASGAGIQSLPLHGAYGSNKEAIRGLSRIAAKEWGKYGITVNVINPYVASAESKRYEREHPEVIAQIVKSMPLGHIGDAELNVGRLCVFLAKAEGRYQTGASFDVDGGSSIRP